MLQNIYLLSSVCGIQYRAVFTTRPFLFVTSDIDTSAKKSYTGIVNMGRRYTEIGNV